MTARFRPFDPSGGFPELGPDTVITAITSFFIRESNECFTFDSSSEGWLFQGVFDANTGDQIAPGDCPETTTSDTGKLAVNMSSSCFPVEVPNSEFWRFDFLSSELDQHSSWQNISGAVVQMAANVPIQVQPLLSYRTASGDETTIREVDDSGVGIFHPVGDSFFTSVNLYSQLTLPSDATATRFRVRVFGRPMDINSPEPLVSLNHVCPTIRYRPAFLNFPFKKDSIPPPPDFIDRGNP